jgi:uncharacterized membrane protein YkvA (DUF1232 family)
LVRKGLGVAVAAYAALPIDLISDFVPVIGYLDDLIILPLGIALVIKLIPPNIMAEHRALAASSQNRPISWTAAAIFIAVGIGAVALCGWMVYRYFTDRS